jgi:hypothetical protein
MTAVISGDTGIDLIQDGAVSTPAKLAAAVVTAPKVSGAQTGTAPVYGCRAWCMFDGTRNVTDTGASTNGQPVLLKASGNVTSVTKNATGDYTVNFTTAMPSADYAFTGHVKAADRSLILGGDSVPTAPTASSFRFTVFGSTTVTNTDASRVSLVVFA